MMFYWQFLRTETFEQTTDILDGVKYGLLKLQRLLAHKFLSASKVSVRSKSAQKTASNIYKMVNKRKSKVSSDKMMPIWCIFLFYMFTEQFCKHRCSSVSEC